MNNVIDYAFPTLIVLFLAGGIYFFWQNGGENMAVTVANETQVAAGSTANTISLEGVETLPVETLTELFATTSATTTATTTP